MGKSFKRYDKFEKFEEHDPRDKIYHDKLRTWNVKRDRSIHHDKKMEILQSLPGANSIGDISWKDD